MPKRIIQGNDAKKAFKVGIDIVADAVKTTLGYGGKNVFISNNMLQPPFSTKDGVTVAKSIRLADPVENAAAMAVIEIAEKTAKESGDGTSSCTLLCQAIVSEGLQRSENDINVAELKIGIEKATAKVVETLKSLSIPIGNDNEKIKQVATLSANGDAEIGGLIADAFEKIGNNVYITMEDSKDENTTITYEEGYRFERGWSSPFWVTNAEKMVADLKDPAILLFDGKLSSWADLKSVLDAMMSIQKRELLIICEEVDGQLRDNLIRNKVEGIINVVCVVSPSYGERRTQMMDDIAVLTSATFVSPRSGHKLKDATIEIAKSWLGTCSKATVSKDMTTIVSGAGGKDKIDAQVIKINSLIEQSSSEFEKEHLAQRISKITCSIAVLHVGGATPLEMKEKKYRVEDAIMATNAAIEEGILPGGGTSLIRCVDILNSVQTDTDDERVGVKIIQKAIQSPLWQIADNVGKSGALIVELVKSATGNQGYNAKTKQIEDLVLAGIIDPTKVVRVALENAASFASMVIISECLICEIPEKVQNN